MTTPSSAPLPRRPLGRTGIDLTVLTAGTWGLASQSYGAVFPEQQQRTLERAVARGVHTFDMAPAWGPDGHSERMVASAVGPRRAEMVYITRAGQVPTEAGYEPAFDAITLRSQCEESLRRLETERIDVWLLHNAREHELRSEDAIRTAEELLTAGKIRAWGASVSHIDDARAALTAGVQVLSVPYHIFATTLFQDIADDCAARQVGVIVHSVLFHGLLSGVYAPGRRFPQTDHRAARFSQEALSERLRQVASLRPLVQPPVRTLAGLALQFALMPHTVASAVVGARTPGQLDAAVDVLESGVGVLSDATLNALRVLAPPA